MQRTPTVARLTLILALVAALAVGFGFTTISAQSAHAAPRTAHSALLGDCNSHGTTWHKISESGTSVDSLYGKESRVYSGYDAVTGVWCGFIQTWALVQCKSQCQLSQTFINRLWSRDPGQSCCFKEYESNITVSDGNVHTWYGPVLFSSDTAKLWHGEAGAYNGNGTDTVSSPEHNYTPCGC